MKIILATDDTLKDIIKTEVKRFSLNADLNHIDVSNVTNMDSMFWNSDFNGDIINWDTSKVTNMTSMFERTSSFDKDLSNWVLKCNVNDTICLKLVVKLLQKKNQLN